MGSGVYSSCSFRDYSTSRGWSYDVTTNRVTGHQFVSKSLKESLNPYGKIRECCNSDEHPNTVPVILALDVTGSMGEACKETASAISQIMNELYNRFKDIELMTMGVGDFECDDFPLQASQFESDVRIAKQMDDIYIEHGGGGNEYESYTAPWWFGLYRTKLDCFDKQGRKGIIITMGDEPLNPTLPDYKVLGYLGSRVNLQNPNVPISKGKDDNHHGSYIFDTKKLYEEASKKFDIFHIAIDDSNNCYASYKDGIERTFRPILGERLKISTIDNLKTAICDCISEAISGQPVVICESNNNLKFDENGGVIW